MRKRKEFFVGKKKGVSVMVGYVLLIVFVIIIGGIIYQWLKTYVPAQAINCPEGVSLFIKETTFNSTDSRLIVTLRNNGRFSLAGYFIHVTNSSDQELPIIDLSGYLNETSPGKIHGNSVVFILATGNLFQPGSENSYLFDIPPEIGEPNLIRITPTRFQKVDEKDRFVSCSNARSTQAVGEPAVECISDDISVTCGTWVCGQKVNNCGELVSCDDPGCTFPDVCNIGVCVPEAACTDTCSSLGYECGTWTICGETVSCPPDDCGDGFSCNVGTGLCEVSCGNGVINAGEECDDGNSVLNDGCSDCTIDIGWECTGEPSDCGEIGSYGCEDYCVDIDQGYSTGFCTANIGQCTSQGGTSMGIGPEVFCQPEFYCCCTS